MLLKEKISDLIRMSIAEDLGSGDITSEACLSSSRMVMGKFILKESGIIAGLPFLQEIFEIANHQIVVELLVEEGGEYEAGTVIASVSGPAGPIFSVERVVLNLLQHISGVATTTASYVEKVEGYSCDILDTRKTLPGLRSVERYAVVIGGGKNHRYALDDRFIIKNKHLALLAQEVASPIKEAVKRVRNYRSNAVIEIGVENLLQLPEAIAMQPDYIMLDRMNIYQVRKAVKMIAGRSYVEVSGDITLDTIRAYAETGVDGISVGALTSSVQEIDIRLRFKSIV